MILIAAGVRLLYWYQVYDEAWFQAPGMDPEFYSQWARAILSGNAADYFPFPRAPLYPYLLAGTYRLFGEHWIFPRIINLCADLASVVIIYRIVIGFGGRTAALAASVLFALCGSAIYYSGEVLMTSLATAVAGGYLYFQINTFEKPEIKNATLSGLFLSLLVLFRPNALILFPVVVGALAYVLLVSHHSKPLPVIFANILVFTLVISPVTVTNLITSDRIVPISTQGGVNFYIGNARGSTGWASSLPDVGAGWTDQDARVIAESTAGRTLSKVEVSRHLWRKGLIEIADSPVDWIKLMFRKTALLLNAREIGNNRPYSLATDSSTVIKVLSIISMGFLLPFAVLGLFNRFRQLEVRCITLFSVAFGGSLLLFFVNSRYRMPLVPGVVMLAGIGFGDLWKAISIGKKTLARNIGVICIVGMIMVPVWIGNTSTVNPAQAPFVHGNALMRLGKASDALKQYSLAAKLDPAYPDLHLNMGVGMMQEGDTIGAKQQFLIELDNHSKNTKACNNLGIIAESEDSLDQAEQFYRRAIDRFHYNSDARVNLGNLLIRKGDNYFQEEELKLSEREYRDAMILLPGDPKPVYRLALVTATMGNIKEAKSYLEKSLELDPDYPPAKLLTDQPPFNQ